MKKILIVIALLFLTGCSVNYNLEIKDNTIKENIKGNILKNEFDPIEDEYGDHTIYSLLYDDQAALIDDSSLYQKKIKKIGNKIKFNYSYNYNHNLDKSRLLNSCYENVLYEETDEYYIIKLSGNFYCDYTDDITVNLITDKFVLNNNADKVKGSTYTWYLNQDNTDIEVTLYKTRNKKSSGMSIFRTIGLIVLLVLGLITYVIYKKRENNS